MTQLRCTLVALLGLTLAACGDNATIVSVNISYADDVEAPAKVHVLLTQGSSKSEDTFDAPTNRSVVDMMTTDVPDRGFFRRYDLSGWSEGEAELTVELINAAGAVYMTDKEPVEIIENGAVAAYAEFKLPEPDETSGDTGSGATDSASTAPSSTAADTSTSAAAETSTGDVETTDAATESEDSEESSTDEGDEADSGDASSSDDASVEAAE